MRSYPPQTSGGGGGSGPDTLNPVGPVTSSISVDWGDCVLIDTTSGNVSITLPPSTGSGSKLEIYKQVAAHEVHVYPDSGTINGQSSLVMLADYESWVFRDFSASIVLAS